MKFRILSFGKRLAYKLISGHFRRLYTNNHKRQLKRFSRSAGFSLSQCQGEEAFVAKWKPLYKDVNVDFYRFYSHYIGLDTNIVPDDIFHYIIEPVLNSRHVLPVYSDKNLFEKLIDRDVLPVCVLRNIGGDFMNRDYHIIQMDDEEFARRIIRNEELKAKGRFIIKPTTNTSGGHGVKLFLYKPDEGWKSTDGDSLSLSFIKEAYKKDFIIQECIEPSDFVKQFNPSSYSTLRIFTYRSVKDDLPHFIGGYLRVGAKGSFKDNVWGGGYAVPITQDGKLFNFASDAKRKRYGNVNGINLKDKSFEIPNWDMVLQLVSSVACILTPTRLLSYDIILDQNNVPHIIEFNTRSQTVTTVQTTTKTFFGEYTDEVIDYCLKNKHRISYQINFSQ